MSRRESLSVYESMSLKLRREVWDLCKAGVISICHGKPWGWVASLRKRTRTRSWCIPTLGGQGAKGNQPRRCKGTASEAAENRERMQSLEEVKNAYHKGGSNQPYQMLLVVEKLIRVDSREMGSEELETEHRQLFWVPQRKETGWSLVGQWRFFSKIEEMKI